jgi:hypothetical protein
VFQLSRIVIEQSSDLTAHAPDDAVLTGEDRTIMVVLSRAGHALIISEIVREAAKQIRENVVSARKEGLVTLSETKVRERVPILETHGLVTRPMGPKGKTCRKGIGITTSGQTLLQNSSLSVR